MGRVTWIIWVSPVPMALMLEEGATPKAAFRTRKGKEMGTPLEPPEGTRLC